MPRSYQPWVSARSGTHYPTTVDRGYGILFWELQNQINFWNMMKTITFICMPVSSLTGWLRPLSRLRTLYQRSCSSVHVHGYVLNQACVQIQDIQASCTRRHMQQKYSTVGYKNARLEQHALIMPIEYGRIRAKLENISIFMHLRERMEYGNDNRTVYNKNGAIIKNGSQESTCIVDSALPKINIPVWESKISLKKLRCLFHLWPSDIRVINLETNATKS